MYHTTVLFREYRDYGRLKVAAVVNRLPIAELLDQMVHQELMMFTKAEAVKMLVDHPDREHLLAAL